jgi:hypothetical protein
VTLRHFVPPSSRPEPPIAPDVIIPIQGTKARIPLGLYKLSQVREACTAKGWQFQ